MSEEADDGISYEDATGRKPVAGPSVAPSGDISYEEAMGYLPESERGPLSNVPTDTSTDKAAKAVGTAVIKGATHLPFTGMVGDLMDLGDMAAAYTGSLITGKPFVEVYSSQKKFANEMKEAQTGKDSTVMGRLGYYTDPTNLPSGADIQKRILPHTGEYKPESEAGETGMAFLEGTTSGLSPSGKAGIVEKGLDIAKRAVPAGVGAATGETVGRITENPALALGAGLAAGAGSAAIPKVAGAHFFPEDPAKRIVGQALRESATDTDAVKSRLGQTPPKYLPDFTPSSSQLSGDAGQAALDARLKSDPRLMPKEGEGALVPTQLEGQEATNVGTVQKGTEEAADRLKQDLQSQYGLTGTAPRTMASAEARQIFSTMEEAASDNVKNLWESPSLKNVSMYRNKSIDAVDSYIKGLSPSERQKIPKDVMDVINEIKTSDSRDIPLDHIQKLRSQVLGAGREAFVKGDNFSGMVNNQLGKQLADILNNEKNIVFGDKASTVRNAWKDAVDATRDYHETFNTGFLRDLNKEVGGAEKVALDATFQKMLAGANSRQNIDQLQKATNGAINDHLANYLVADMTGDGSKIVKPQEVDRWLAKGNNNALVDKVPGLRDRINAIKQSSSAQQLSDNFAAASTSPEKLVKLFDNARAEINEHVRTPADIEYFNMLENSARAIAKIPPSGSANLSAINKLAENKTSDLLYGVATGRIARNVAGYAATKGIESVSGIPIGSALEILGSGVLGNVKLGDYSLGNLTESLLSGGVRQKAMDLLQQSRTNPDLRRQLMEKPNIESLASLFGANQARVSATGAKEGVESRQGRATGGSVLDHHYEADRLVNMAEKAKRGLGEETKAILNQPDDAVVHALEIAKRAI